MPTVTSPAELTSVEKVSCLVSPFIERLTSRYCGWSMTVCESVGFCPPLILSVRQDDYGTSRFCE